jgi:hypothetical protein
MRKKIVGDLNAVRLGAIPPNRAGVLFQGYGQLIAAYREEERQLSKDAMGLEEVAALFDKFLAVVLAHVPDIGTRLLIGAGIGALMDGIGVPEVSSVGNQLPEIISVK